jgi:DNA-binding NarL/FixJ family response regulator
VEQEPPRVGLALGEGLLRDALAAGLARHGLRVVAACRPQVSALGPLLVARPDVLLLAMEDDPLEASRSEGCLRRAALAGVPVVALSAAAGRAAAGPLAAGVTATVTRDDPLELVVERLRDAAAAGRRSGRGQLAAVPTAPGAPLTAPALSAQEERTLVLYVSGLKLVAVARRLGVRYDTAKGYLDRVRDKYAAAGRPARTKTELYRVALQDGRLGHDGPQGLEEPDDGAGRPTG